MFHVAPWSDGDVADSSSLEAVQIWAHLKRVPFDLMTNEGLSWIADAIGTPKEMDDWTKNLSSLSVAHVKVEADAMKPFPTVLELVRQSGAIFRVDVEYPCLPPTCSHCKELGHIIKDCLKIKRQWIPVQKQNTSAETAAPATLTTTVLEPPPAPLIPPTTPASPPAPVSPTSQQSTPYQIISSGSGLGLSPLPVLPSSPSFLSSPVTMDTDPPSPIQHVASTELSPIPSPPSPPSPPPSQNFVLALAATVMPKSSIPPPPPAAIPLSPLSFPPLTSKNHVDFKPLTSEWESPKRKNKITQFLPSNTPASNLDFHNPFAPLSNSSFSKLPIRPSLPSIPPSSPPINLPVTSSPMFGSIPSPSPDGGTLLEGVPPQNL